MPLKRKLAAFRRHIAEEAATELAGISQLPPQEQGHAKEALDEITALYKGHCAHTDMVTARQLLSWGNWEPAHNNLPSKALHLREHHRIPSSLMLPFYWGQKWQGGDPIEAIIAESPVTPGVTRAMNQICGAQMFAQGKEKFLAHTSGVVTISGTGVNLKDRVASACVCINDAGPEFLESLRKELAAGFVHAHA